MINCSLYQREVEPVRTFKEKYNKDVPHKERLKIQQQLYYKRRGFFNYYKRKVAIKLNLPFEELKHISNQQSLDLFCGEILKTKYDITTNYKPTSVLLTLVEN